MAVFTESERERLERLGIGVFDGWTVTLKRGGTRAGGELDQTFDGESEAQAKMRATILAKRYGLTRKGVKIDKGRRKITVDASDYYTTQMVSR